MSEPLRVGLVAEGPTDFIAAKTILAAVLGTGISFVCTQIQPEVRPSEPLGGSADASQIQYEHGGWGGVYKWCTDISANGAEDVFAAGALQFDVLIIHLDVDVSGFTYKSAKIHDHVGLPLPCNKPCPPASDSADALREVALSWLSPVTTDYRVVWCLPAVNMETWVYVCQQKQITGKKPVECRNDIPHKVHKSKKEYLKLQPTLYDNWARVEMACPQAKAFSDALRTARSQLTP